jgi:MSHA biogenesis protein MshQ
MPLTAQYWTGSAWLKNSYDICSTGINLSLTDPNTGDGLLPAKLCAWDNGAGSGLSGLGCSVAGTGSLQFKKPPLSGNFNLNFKATGANNSGYLDVTAVIPTYLQFNWRGAGNTNPTARATFGIYKDNDKVIYFRELY